MQQFLTRTLVPRKLLHLASYKLGITLAKHKNPLAYGETVIEWAIASDPSSKVFKAMPKIRQMLSCHVNEIANFIQTEKKLLLFKSL